MKRSRNLSPVVLSATIAMCSGLLAGCEPEEKAPSLFETVAACENVHGVGNCVEPAPILMTEDNKPLYEKPEDCSRDFGEGNCRPAGQVAHGGGVVYHPIFMPGHTAYYPPGSGYMGYYGGAYNASYAGSPSTSGKGVVVARSAVS